MAAVNKIDSNVVGLSYCEEVSIGVLNGDANDIWVPLDPNSFSDFGGSVSTVSRQTINPSRQVKKGVVTDVEASGGFNIDFTQTNIQNLMQGFFFADFREKGQEAVTAVDTDTVNPDEYEVASTTGFFVNSIIIGKNFTNAGNNAMNVVTAIVADTSVEVADGQLTAEASPPSDAVIQVVGYQATADDIDVDVSGTYPALSSTSLDFTTLGLTIGEWIYIGGDSALLGFSNSENNGFKRIKSIAANLLTLDKSESVMVTETSSGSRTVQMFFGRFLKNESTSSLITRRTYNLERTLGDEDDASSSTQSEYIAGAVPSELSINVPSADKVTADLSFMGTAHETRSSATGVKPGTRNTLDEEDAYNTSSDIPWNKMYVLAAGNEAPSALFAYVTDLTFTINNNLQRNQAVGVTGAFDITAGLFTVSGSLTAYFTDVASIAAVQANSDVTLHTAFVRENLGFLIDLPMLTLSDAKANVELNQPITLPISHDASSAANYDENFDYTMGMMFFDYLPTAAG